MNRDIENEEELTEAERRFIDLLKTIDQGDWDYVSTVSLLASQNNTTDDGIKFIENNPNTTLDEVLRVVTDCDDRYNSNNKIVGYIKEFYRDDSLPSIFDLVSEEANYDKEAVLRYLEGGECFAAAPACLTDEIDGTPMKPGFYLMTDGEYDWRSDIIHYIQKYNISLRQDFLDKVSEQAKKGKI